jgi:hypothetical protein
MTTELLAEILDMLDSLPAGAAMASEPKHDDWVPAHGGRWRSPGDKVQIFLPAAVILNFRGTAGNAGPGALFLYNGTVQIGGTRVNACLSYQTEVSREQGWLSFLARDPAIHRHCIVSIVEINFSFIEHRSIPELDGRREQIAGLLRSVAGSLLDRALKATSHAYGGEVSGELREHWQDPRPEIAGFHQHVDDCMIALRRNGLSEVSAGRFSFQPQGLDHIAMIDGEPDVAVLLPTENREDPDFYEAMVRIGGVKVPIGIQRLGVASLDTILPVPREEPCRWFSLYGVIHPYSPRLGVTLRYSEMPADADPDIVAAAVRYVRGAWMAWRNQQLDGRHRAEVIVL